MVDMVEAMVMVEVMVMVMVEAIGMVEVVPSVDDLFCSATFTFQKHLGLLL